MSQERSKELDKLLSKISNAALRKKLKTAILEFLETVEKCGKTTEEILKENIGKKELKEVTKIFEEIEENKKTLETLMKRILNHKDKMTYVQFSLFSALYNTINEVTDKEESQKAMRYIEKLAEQLE